MRVKATPEQLARLRSKDGQRAVVTGAKLIDEEKRTVTLTIATETEVDRWWYREILDCTPEAVDLSRLNDGGAVRDTHYGDQIGVCEKAYVDSAARKVIADIRFSKNQRGDEIFKDVVDGIRRNSSIRYTIDEAEEEPCTDEVVCPKCGDDRKCGDRCTCGNLCECEDCERGIITYRVTKWSIIHVSMEPDGADPNAGVGRSDEEKISGSEQVFTIKQKRSSDTMQLTEQEKQALKEQLRAEVMTELNAARTEAEAKETLRKANIRAVAIDFAQSLPGVNLDREALNFISDTAKTEGDFRAFVMEKMKDPAAIRSAESNVGMSAQDVQNYSICKVIEALSTRDFSKLGVELEASNALAKKLNRSDVRGILLPGEIQARSFAPKGDRTLVVGTPANGGYTVHTEYIPQSFLEVLSNALVSARAGVSVLNGLVGNISMTRELTANTFYWVGEGSGPSASDITFGQTTMTPKTGGALAQISHQFLTQNSIGGEAYVMRKLGLAAALGSDRAVFYGTGSNYQPKGVKYQSGIGGVEGTNFDRAKALEIIRQVKAANALTLGSPQWVMDATTESILQNIAVGTAGRYLLEDGKMLGYASVDSNQIDANDLFFGVWSSVLLGYWGAPELRANEYGSGFAAGSVDVRVLLDLDVFIEYPGAISYTSGVQAGSL